MHPAERLRFVARSSGAPRAMLVEEAAAGLVAFLDDPGALVMACRRVIAAQPASGALVWLAAHILAAPEPRVAAREAVARIGTDRTSRRLARWLPHEATVCVLGWPELTSGALAQRGDVGVLTLDVGGEGAGLARWLEHRSIAADVVPVGAVAAAVSAVDVLVIEASAVGPAGAVAPTGSLAAAAVAARFGAVQCVLVAGVGAMLPAPMFGGVERRLAAGTPGWLADDELVPLDLIDMIADDDGVDDFETALRRTDCPVIAELFTSNGGLAP